MQTPIPLNAGPRWRVPLPVIVGALVVTGVQVQASELPEVTVSAPSMKTIGRDANGAPIHQATATARIRYSPVMLMTNSGRALLQYKVTEVARGLCRKLNTVAFMPPGDEGACVQQAVDGAKLQIAAAIAQQKEG